MSVTKNLESLSVMLCFARHTRQQSEGWGNNAGSTKLVHGGIGTSSSNDSYFTKIKVYLEFVSRAESAEGLSRRSSVLANVFRAAIQGIFLRDGPAAAVAARCAKTHVAVTLETL